MSIMVCIGQGTFLVNTGVVLKFHVWQNLGPKINCPLFISDEVNKDIIRYIVYFFGCEMLQIQIDMLGDLLSIYNDWMKTRVKIEIGI